MTGLPSTSLDAFLFANDFVEFETKRKKEEEDKKEAQEKERTKYAQVRCPPVLIVFIYLFNTDSHAFELYMAISNRAIPRRNTPPKGNQKKKALRERRGGS